MVEKDRHDPLMKAKLVHIITLLELGGAQENTLINCEMADRDLFEVHLISGKGGMLDGRAERIEGLTFYQVKELVREIKPLWDAVSLLKIFRILRKLKKMSPKQPVIVHTHSSKAGIVGRVAAAMAGCEIIIHTVHGFGFNPLQSSLARRIFIMVERIVGRITDYFVLVSEDNGRRGIGLGIFDAGKTVLIRSGFNTEEFGNPSRERGREILGLEDDKFTVGMVACFKPQKSPLDFVKMANVLKEKGYDFRYVMVGDGEMGSEIMKNILDLGLGNNFLLPGWVENIRDVIAAFDALVLTSLWEGLPKVIPQALIAGVPVVSTAVDGTAEVVEDGVNGFLIDVRSPSEAAERIIRAREGEIKREALEKGKEDLISEFSEKEMVRKHRELYRKLLEAGAWKA